MGGALPARVGPRPGFVGCEPFAHTALRSYADTGAGSPYDVVVSDEECRSKILTPELARDLWQRVRGIVLDEGRRVSPRFKPLLRDFATAEDFVGTYIENCLSRSERGTLALQFDPARGSLVDYLSSSRILEARARDFARSLRRGRGEAPDVAAAPGIDGARAALAAGGVRLLSNVQLRWPASSPGAIEIMAATQLWPRLERRQPAWPAIERAVAEAIRAAAGPSGDGHGKDPIGRLEAEHREAERRHAQREADLWEQGKGGKASLRARRHQGQLLDELRHHRCVQPLDAAALARLLGLAANAAHKRLERYRAKLKKLVVGLAESAAELGLIDDDEEDGDG